MRRTASIFIIVLIGLLSLVTFQNCSKQATVQTTALPSVAFGTAITGQNYEAPNVYSQGIIATNPPVVNPSVVTLTGAVNADVPGLKTIFYNGNFMTVVPGQSLFIQIAYPQSINLSSTDLFWNNIQNGVSLAKTAYSGTNKNLSQLDFYRDGKSTSLPPAIYTFQLEGDSKANGSVIARSNSISVNMAPVCNVTYSATRIANDDKVIISVNSMYTMSGDISTNQSIAKFILIPSTPSGVFNQQILVPNVSNASAELQASQLNLAENSFRLLGLASNGDIVCGSNPQVLSVYKPVATPTPTPTPTPAPSPTPNPYQKVTLVTEGYLCSDHQLRVRVRHNVNKLVTADIMGSDSSGNIGYNCGYYTTPQQVQIGLLDGSRSYVDVSSVVAGTANVKLDRITGLNIKVVSYQEVQRIVSYREIVGNLYNQATTYNFNLLSSGYCPINSISGIAIFANAFPGYAGQVAKVRLEIEVEGYNDGQTPNYPLSNSLYSTCTFTPTTGGGGSGGGSSNTYVPTQKTLN